MMDHYGPCNGHKARAHPEQAAIIGPCKAARQDHKDMLHGCNTSGWFPQQIGYLNEVAILRWANKYTHLCTYGACGGP